MKKQQILFYAFACVLFAQIVGLGPQWLKSYREYSYLKRKQQRLFLQRDQLRENLSAKERYLASLLHQPSFLERVARKRLGYTRTDEIVLRFQSAPRMQTGDPIKH